MTWVFLPSFGGLILSSLQVQATQMSEEKLPDSSLWLLQLSEGRIALGLRLLNRYMLANQNEIPQLLENEVLNIVYSAIRNNDTEEVSVRGFTVLSMLISDRTVKKFPPRIGSLIKSRIDKYRIDQLVTMGVTCLSVLLHRKVELDLSNEELLDIRWTALNTVCAYNQQIIADALKTILNHTRVQSV